MTSEPKETIYPVPLLTLARISCLKKRGLAISSRTKQFSWSHQHTCAEADWQYTESGTAGQTGMSQSSRDNLFSDTTPQRSWFGTSLVRISRRIDACHPVTRAPHFAKSVQEWREKVLLETPELSNALRAIDESFDEFEYS